jgi:hypothetical protein
MSRPCRVENKRTDQILSYCKAMSRDLGDQPERPNGEKDRKCGPVIYCCFNSRHSNNFLQMAFCFNCILFFCKHASLTSGVQDAGLGVIELEEGRHEGAGELFLHPQHRLPEVVVPLTFLLQVLLRVVLLLLGFSTNHNPNYGHEVLGGGEAFERLKRGGRRRVLEPHPRNNPQVADEIRAEKTHTTHANTVELISFWCSKLDCIF